MAYLGDGTDVFPTTPGDPNRTAGGGFVNNVIPDFWTLGGDNSTLTQTMQQNNINPNLYGALAFQGYAQPEFANAPNVGSNTNTSGSQTARTAYLSYLQRLKDTEAARTAAAVQNRVPWTNSQIQGNAYNANGGNSYAIQNAPVQESTPLFNQAPVQSAVYNAPTKEQGGLPSLYSGPANPYVAPTGSQYVNPNAYANTTPSNIVNQNSGTNIKEITNPLPALARTITNTPQMRQGTGGNLSSSGNPQYIDAPLQEFSQNKQIANNGYGNNNLDFSPTNNIRNNSINWTKALWR